MGRDYCICGRVGCDDEHTEEFLGKKAEEPTIEAEMLAMLKRLEWCQEQYPWYDCCPICLAPDAGEGHKDNCELAALIAKAGKEVQG